MTKADLLEAIKDCPMECEIAFLDGDMHVTPSEVDCDGVLIYLDSPRKVG